MVVADEAQEQEDGAGERGEDGDARKPIRLARQVATERAQDERRARESLSRHVEDDAQHRKQRARCCAERRDPFAEDDEQHERERAERETQNERAPTLRDATHARHVGLRARLDDAGEIFRQINLPPRARERGVQQTQQATLFGECDGARATRREMLLEQRTLGDAQLAVEVRGNVGAVARGARIVNARRRVRRSRRRILHRVVRVHLVVLAHILSMPRSRRGARIASRARKILFLTVPSGKPVTSAISS